MVNHVDRTPSRVRTLVPGISTVPCDPMTVSVFTRPDELSCACASMTRPFIFRRFASVAPVKATGPHVWCGEIESYGSATDTRYGTGLPQTSSADAVRPPDVEKKKVLATCPS